ncbi:MAG: hypothetical protein JWQ48_1355 [Conexibacter sp.]|nr:hypothetical protein [Conexibacter sp.]
MNDAVSSEPVLAVPTFFNDHEARTVDALAGCVIPGDAEDPGAREAGAVEYIDRSLSGAYHELAGLYRRGVTELDELCRERHGGAFFALASEQQHAVLVELDDPVSGAHGADGGVPAGGGDARQARVAYFFAVVREHVVQGTFCDPVYGGNRDAVGWRLVGFPGAYWGYEEQHGQLGFDSRQLQIKTLEDLRRERSGIAAGNRERTNR